MTIAIYGTAPKIEIDRFLPLVSTYLHKHTDTSFLSACYVLFSYCCICNHTADSNVVVYHHYILISRRFFKLKYYFVYKIYRLNHHF